MTLFIGIDPGAKGAIATIDSQDNKVTLYPMPTVKDLKDLKLPISLDSVAVVENVRALPNQSCTSSFSFGFNTCIAHVIANRAKEVIKAVDPRTWQKYFNLYKQGETSKTEKKHNHIKKALELYPHLEHIITPSKDGYADALLIATWLKETYNNE